MALTKKQFELLNRMKAGARVDHYAGHPYLCEKGSVTKVHLKSFDRLIEVEAIKRLEDGSWVAA